MGLSRCLSREREWGDGYAHDGRCRGAMGWIEKIDLIDFIDFYRELHGEDNEL